MRQLGICRLFESPMDLHYSQTIVVAQHRERLFESPMDLHYSQTNHGEVKSPTGLNPLWIYTTLKQRNKRNVSDEV